jgi:hypothetical protein
VEAEEYRRFSAEVWSAMAPGWERWRGHLTHALSPGVSGWSASSPQGPATRCSSSLQQLAEAVAPFSAGGGYELPGVCLNAIAR